MSDTNINNQKIFYFGHRGAPKLATENTINSIKKSIQKGADGVEIDIQKTIDNKIILFHDSYFEYNSSKKYISTTTYKELVNICIRNNVNPPDKFVDFLIFASKYPNIIFNIEIKSQGIFNFDIVSLLKEELRSHQLNNQIILSSFNFIIMMICKIFFSRKMLALIISSGRSRGLINAFFNRLMILILNPKYLHLSKMFLDNQLVTWSKNRGMRINIYTVNTDKDLQECINHNIDGVFTDNHQHYVKREKSDLLNH